MACRLWVIYVREENDSNVQAITTRPIWTIWTLLSAVPRKAAKCNNSHSLRSIWCQLEKIRNAFLRNGSTKYLNQLNYALGVGSYFQILAWHRFGDKPIPGPTLISLNYTQLARTEWVINTSFAIAWQGDISGIAFQTCVIYVFV